MNSKASNNVEFFIQLDSQYQIKYSQQINTKILQIQDHEEGFLEENNYNMNRKLQDQILQNLAIAEEEETITNKTICEFIYQQQQNSPKQLNNNQQQIIPKQILSKNNEKQFISEYIKNILFIKFVQNFQEQKIKQNQGQLDKKNVETLEAEEQV